MRRPAAVVKAKYLEGGRERERERGKERGREREREREHCRRQIHLYLLFRDIHMDPFELRCAPSSKAAHDVESIVYVARMIDC